jgi:osmotically-inducible protein OsmY
MNVKESINSQGESFSVEEKFIHSTENPSFYDAKIKQSILVSLAWYCNVPVKEICVDVNHGNVTLYGMVQSRYQRIVISVIVKKTKGVSNLTNNICVVNEFVPLSI